MKNIFLVLGVVFAVFAVTFYFVGMAQGADYVTHEDVRAACEDLEQKIADHIPITPRSEPRDEMILRVKGNEYAYPTHIVARMAIIRTQDNCVVEIDQSQTEDLVIFAEENAVIIADSVKTKHLTIFAKNSAAIHFGTVNADTVRVIAENNADVQIRVLVAHEVTEFDIKESAVITCQTLWSKEVYLTRKNNGMLRIVSNANIPIIHIDDRSLPTNIKAHIQFRVNREDLYGVEEMTISGTGTLEVGSQQLWNIRLGEFLESGIVNLD